MEIIFVINDGDGRYIEYEHTGVLNAPNRRAVVVKLTPEQVAAIGIQKIGVNCGRDVLETIESVSVNQQKSANP